ncbi:hypothetical protein EDB85DRAFT_1885481 [Lactarius pseudohatsudake]|nr:hypothetical protein EDB85DRAFT_1885481 [Lactarius pseudohatsudake]
MPYVLTLPFGLTTSTPEHDLPTPTPTPTPTPIPNVGWTCMPTRGHGPSGVPPGQNETECGPAARRFEAGWVDVRADSRLWGPRRGGTSTRNCRPGYGSRAGVRGSVWGSGVSEPEPDLNRTGPQRGSGSA